MQFSTVIDHLFTTYVLLPKNYSTIA